MKRMKIPRSTLALSSSGVGKGGGDKAVSRFVYQEKNKAGEAVKEHGSICLGFHIIHVSFSVAVFHSNTFLVSE